MLLRTLSLYIFIFFFSLTSAVTQSRINTNDYTDNRVYHSENDTTSIVILYNYYFSGITLGDPGGFNLLYGYHFNKIGIRGEVGFIPANTIYYGYQINLMYNLSKTENFEHNISLGYGLSSCIGPNLDDVNSPTLSGFNNQYYKWNYIGFYYDLTYYILFIESGLTFGIGTFKNPQFSIQLGFVLRNL